MRYIPLLIALASPAWAQDCKSLEAQLTELRDSFGQTIRTQGLTTDGLVHIMTASPDGGWSAMLVTPDSIACIVAAGEAFAAHDAEAQGENS
jgi:hypothetical protein